METSSNNLLVQEYNLYLESEIFFTELKALYFTHKSILPLLNCVACGCRDHLLQILPLLWDDLKKGELGTLKKYEVNYKHVPITSPSNIYEKKLLKLMHKDASKTIERLSVSVGGNMTFVRIMVPI
jgi:hypothetical protein